MLFILKSETRAKTFNYLNENLNTSSSAELASKKNKKYQSEEAAT